MTARRFEAGVRFNDAACGADDLDVPSAGFLMQCHQALGDTAAAQAAARECVIRAEKALAAEPDTGAPLAMASWRSRCWVKRSGPRPGPNTPCCSTRIIPCFATTWPAAWPGR